MERKSIPSRILIPRKRSDFVPRPRLLSLLLEMLEKRLVLVTAPAGYGKTSLLVDLARSTELPVCWLSLSPEDYSILNFITTLTKSIQQRFPLFGNRTLSLVDNVSDGQLDIDGLAAAMAGELFEATSEHFMLILDDLHLAADNAPIMRLLSQLLRHVDENVHFIFSSRTTLPLPALPALVAQGDVTGLSLDELAFSVDEVRAFYLQNHGSELPVETAERLVKQTEGWITGILLSDKLAPAAREGLARINRITGVGLDEYFLQLIDRQPGELRRFLLLTSLLEEFNASHYQEVLGTILPLKERTADEWMEVILQQNLFAIPVGENGTWVRYHHLFLDFLQSRAYRELPAESQIAERTLAQWHLDQKDWEPAYAILRRLGTLDELVSLIERSGHELTGSGRIITLSSWLDALPTELLSTRPALISLQGNVAAMNGDLDLATTLYDQAINAMKLPEDYEFLARTLSRRASIHRMAGNLPASLQDAEECLSLIDKDLALRGLKAEVQRGVGVCLNRQGKLNESLGWLTRSLRTAQSVRDLKTEAMIHLEIGLVNESLGNFQRSLEHYQESLNYWQRTDNPIWLANIYNNLGVLRHGLGEHLAALDALDKALFHARQGGHTRMEAFALTGIGDIYLELEAPEEARTVYLQAHQIARNIPENFLLVYLDLQEAELLSLAGDYERALQVVNNAMSLASQDQSLLETHLCTLQNAAILIRQNNPAGILGPLEETCSFFESEGHQLQGHKARLLLTLTNGTLGHKEQLLENLLIVLASLKVDEPSRSLFALAARFQTQLEHLAGLDFIGAQLAPLLAGVQRSREAVPSLRREVRQRSSSLPFARPRLHIRAFGRTQVHINDHLVTSSEWQTQLARDLFLLILSHPEGMTRDEIALIFWPDASPEEVKFRFKNTIYRVRHAVGRDVILLDQEIYRFNNRLDYEFDVESFLRENAQALKTTESLGKLSHFREALKLYKGPYLPEVRETWVLPLRESFRQVHLNILLQVSEIYFDLSSYDLALEFTNRALEEDNCLETAYRLSLRIYAAMGNRAALVRQYNRCCEVLQREINAEPSPQTQNLFAQLMN